MSPQREHKLSKANEAYSFIIEEVKDVVAFSLGDVYPLILYYLRELLDRQQSIVIRVCVLQRFLELKEPTGSL